MRKTDQSKTRPSRANLNSIASYLFGTWSSKDLDGTAPPVCCLQWWPPDLDWILATVSVNHVYDVTLFTESPRGKLWIWPCILVPNFPSCAFTSVSKSCKRNVIILAVWGQGDRLLSRLSGPWMHPPWSLSIPGTFWFTPDVVLQCALWWRKHWPPDTWKLTVGTQPTRHLEDKWNHAKGVECQGVHPFRPGSYALTSGHGLDFDSVTGKRLHHGNQALHPWLLHCSACWEIHCSLCFLFVVFLVHWPRTFWVLLMTFSRRKVFGSRVSVLTSQFRMRSKFNPQRAPALIHLFLLSPGNKKN